VLELVPSGALVGTLAASDPDGHESLTYTLLDSAGGRFRIVGHRLFVDNGFKLDFEQARSHRITVQVADSFGATRIRDFDLAVADLPVERTGGSPFDDVFKAGKHNDVLGGGLGNDRLWGGPGKDTLTGGKGKDVFVFDSKPNRRSNLDKVKDYVARDDAVWLENGIFTKLGKHGTELRPKTLKKAFFTVGTDAKDRNDYLVYDDKTGKLFYDGDGSGARIKAVESAVFTTKPKLTFTEFCII
jgi:Ca2+-binding RTX toxin-like protein